MVVSLVVYPKQMCEIGGTQHVNGKNWTNSL